MICSFIKSFFNFSVACLYGYAEKVVNVSMQRSAKTHTEFSPASLVKHQLQNTHTHPFALLCYSVLDSLSTQLLGVIMLVLFRHPVGRLSSQ